MQSIKVFCSYAPSDKYFLVELENHLSVLARQGHIRIWHVGKVSPGANEEQERVTHLNDADIILLLISSHYMASDECYDIEAKRAVQMQRVGIAHVRLIPVRHIMYENAVFSECRVLPSNGKFVTDGQDKHKVLHQIVEDIEQVVWEAYADKQGREANRVKKLDLLDKIPPIIDMPPLKLKKPTDPAKPSKQTATLVPQRKSVGRSSRTKRKRKAPETVVRSAATQRSPNINLRRRQISRKFNNNRGILFITLFIIDFGALPLTIRSWIDSWLLVVLAAVISFLIFSWGTATTDSLLPILFSLVFAGAWGSLILHLFTWPPATWALVFTLGLIIIVASVHYTLFRKR